MKQEKYVKIMGIIAVVLSSFAFVTALLCMLGFVFFSGSLIGSLAMLPLLIICVFISAITSIIAFINFNSRLGKIAFLLSIISCAFVMVSFILLYN